jgi:hypothetical protein
LSRHTHFVIAGLDPAIQSSAPRPLPLDARVKPGHDETGDDEVPRTTAVRQSGGGLRRLRLNEMLHSQPLRDFLRPRDTGFGLVFTLKEGIVVGRKPR